MPNYQSELTYIKEGLYPTSSWLVKVTESALEQVIKSELVLEKISNLLSEQELNGAVGKLAEEIANIIMERD